MRTNVVLPVPPEHDVHDRRRSAPARTYLLVQTRDDEVAEVARTVRRVRGVETVDMVMGAYDLIAVVGAASGGRTVRAVLASVLRVDGVIRALPCSTTSADQERPRLRAS